MFALIIAKAVYIIQFDSIWSSIHWNFELPLHIFVSIVSRAKMISHAPARERLAMMGVVIYQPEQKYQFILEKAKILSLMISSFISLSLYLLYCVDSLEDYIQAIFLLSVQIITTFADTYCILNTNRIYRILNNLEDIIDASKELKHKIDLFVDMVFQLKIIICRNDKCRVENDSKSNRWNASNCG